MIGGSDRNIEYRESSIRTIESLTLPSLFVMIPDNNKSQKKVTHIYISCQFLKCSAHTLEIYICTIIHPQKWGEGEKQKTCVQKSPVSIFLLLPESLKHYSVDKVDNKIDN